MKGKLVTVHYAVHWNLECTHDVICGCRHHVGQKVYCYVCGDLRKVIKKDKIPVVAPVPGRTQNDQEKAIAIEGETSD